MNTPLFLVVGCGLILVGLVVVGIGLWCLFLWVNLYFGGG